MCAVSMIMDYGRTNPPWQQLPGPLYPQPLPDDEAREAIKKFIALVEAAKKYDAETGQPHCEDPEKAKFEQEVLRRLAEIEKRLGK